MTSAQYREWHANSAPAAAKPASGTDVHPAAARVATGLKTRKTNRHDEDDLQAAIVRFFAYQYPEYAGLLFAVPNGGQRNAREGARLKKGGVVSMIDMGTQKNKFDPSKADQRKVRISFELPDELR